MYFYRHIFLLSQIWIHFEIHAYMLVASALIYSDAPHWSSLHPHAYAAHRYPE